MGKLELSKDHVLCKCTGKFGISERVQGNLCLVGQSVVFDQGSKLLEELMHLKISPPQIQRVCEYYGNAIDPLIKSNCTSIIPQLEIKRNAEPVYVMVDGSMLFTREDKWKELKLGRVFYGGDVVDIQRNRREVLRSIYVSHLGSVDDFFPKLERLLAPYKNKIIIGDGAKWIWNWVEDNYPGATQILDFYHAKEKLVLLAKHQFIGDQKRKQWVNEQVEILLDNGVEKIIAKVKRLRSRNEESKHAKQKVIDYYIEHDDRMQYKTYKEKGLLIGSGPIEAAHRSVIQQRLKLSGQKWSIPGAQAIANLRCYHHSDAWPLVKKIIAAAA